MNPAKLSLSFDIGHASIGWAVFQNDGLSPMPLGTGVVLFQADTCLASVRRGFRRTRRNIAARRTRVKHLKSLLLNMGVLTHAQLEENFVSYPWFLAARVLASDGKETLSWQELWCVLRWYAHNRGYDGNALWVEDATDSDAAEESLKDDAEKVTTARMLMRKHNKETMAETFCAVLGLDPLGEKHSSRTYFKVNNAAFPRDTVEKEVLRILNAHRGVLPKLDNAFIYVLLKNVPEEIRKAQKLPARFSKEKGLLFGQFVPRFDNRIIGKCRITGKNVPLKNCKEYFLYRWGRLLNNLTVFTKSHEIRTLTEVERRKLDEEMRSRGFFTKATLNASLKKITDCEPANTESYFLIPEMEDALVLDPVKKAVATKSYIKELWPHFSAHGKKIFASMIARGKVLRLGDCIKQMEIWSDWQEEEKALFETALKRLSQKEEKKPTGKQRNLFRLRLEAQFPTGRASYCKEILKKTYEESLSAKDSTQEGGCLYETAEIRDRLLHGCTHESSSGGNIDRWISAQTNNHLVRHRLLILSRLLQDIVNEFAQGDATRVNDIVVEVIKDVKEFSGLTSQEIKKKLSEKFCNFNSVAQKLEHEAEAANVPVTASLIRKARLLEDQNWECPYTGKPLSYNELFLGDLEIEHIIPRSLRPSDALSSCVMTFRAVNEMKGQRTAMQFIRETEGATVPGMTIQIRTVEDFESWIASHEHQKLRKTFSREDLARCKRRAELLRLAHYEERNADFTERDLTQTSHLNKLAIRLIKHKLGIDARHLSGAITGFVRKKMNIDECLVSAVPRMQRAARTEKDGEYHKLLKAEMRELSHLHHAMDAITQGLAGIFFKTEDWTLLIKRNLSRHEQSILAHKYSELLSISAQGKIEMKKLPDSLRDAIINRLRECRIARHVPSKMNGMKVEQTTWSIGIMNNDEEIELGQHTTNDNGDRYDSEGKRLVKKSSEKPTKLLGLNPPENTTGKLKKIRGAVKICENWGCALDPEPTVIPYFKVFPKLRELRERNAGKPVRTLRRGQMIIVPQGRFEGIWCVVSIKDNRGGIAVDLNSPDKVRTESKTQDTKINVRLKTLIRDGMKILKQSLTGRQCPTT